MRRLLFLPGVGGDPHFWLPLGERLPPAWDKVYFGWPGLGEQPARADINSYNDLIGIVEAELGDSPVDLLAQSMGGAIAMAVALRHPKKVRRLVLAVTAGGMDVSAFGAQDWRPDYQREYPQAAAWIMDERPDISARLGEIPHPTLLIWGDADPISPVAVGEHFRDHLPNARLHIVADGHHDLIHARADALAPLISAHLVADN